MAGHRIFGLGLRSKRSWAGIYHEVFVFMCGIFGNLSLDGPVSANDVTPALSAMRHRGPDADGIWADETCALGHRRLAIIDLSEAGRQPLANEDGTVWITFNGEVYNFHELRKELTGLGHRFRTATDTEAIVHAYEQWGPDCVRRLRGMFAFGIWDQRRRRLFLARDRLGKKPLFYTKQRDRVLFASELQGILADPEIAREVDTEGIDYYLSFGYIPPPRTGFRGIMKLPPAHWMTVDVDGEGPSIRIERYWSLDYMPKLRVNEAEACEAVREKLTESVRLRMVSDVPLGAFLSGGIDSSIVVGVMAGLSDRPVKTFSIGFDEAAYDELPHARRVADRWGTEHHELVVRPDALAILPMLARHYGEPYADSSAIPTYYVSEFTRSEVTVALNGDGGDEGFLGYDRYWANRMAERSARMPGVRAAAAVVGGCLPAHFDPKSRWRKVRRFLTAAVLPQASRYAQWIGFFGPEAKGRLYSTEMRDALGIEDPMAWFGELFRDVEGLDPAEAAGAVDIVSYLPYDLLVKVDIATMANSLEARSPLLDHELLEYAARLPTSLKLRGRTSKYLLKKAFADVLPVENVRRSKMGFGLPVGRWFRGPLRGLLADTVLSDRSRERGYFNPAEVARLVDEHLTGRVDHTYPIWSLLMLELWHQEMVDPCPQRVSSRL